MKSFFEVLLQHDIIMNKRKFDELYSECESSFDIILKENEDLKSENKRQKIESNRLEEEIVMLKLTLSERNSLMERNEEKLKSENSKLKKKTFNLKLTLSVRKLLLERIEEELKGKRRTNAIEVMNSYVNTICEVENWIVLKYLLLKNVDINQIISKLPTFERITDGLYMTYIAKYKEIKEWVERN